MTKKTMVLALVGALALCAPASAAVLPVKTAKQLAKRLAAKQVRTRQIVSLHIFRPRRVSSSEVRFSYDDRSAQNVFCTSVIVVKGKGGTARARFADRATVCRGIPDAALAYEAATRTAVRDVAGHAGSVRRSVAALERSSAPCRRLHVPSNRRRQVALFEAAAESNAAFGPIDSQLQTFVNALGAVRTSDGVLVAGAAGWTDLLQVYRSVPRFQPSLCAAVRSWARAHWAIDAAPADYAGLKALDMRATHDQQAIARAGAHLGELGVFPRTAVAFTPSGLLALGVGLR